MTQRHDTPEAIGMRLRRLRLMAGWTRNTLAEKAFLSKSSISFWEHGKNILTPRSAAKVIIAIKEAGIDCSEEWLLQGTGLLPSFPEQRVGNIGFTTNDIHRLTQGIGGNLQERIKALDNEINLFINSQSTAVVTKLEDDSMMPIFEPGDIVGGLWQSSQLLTKEKICIVKIDEKLLVRKIKQNANDASFQVSSITYNLAHQTPFEIKGIILKEVAPVIRLWR